MKVLEQWRLIYRKHSVAILVTPPSPHTVCFCRKKKKNSDCVFVFHREETPMWRWAGATCSERGVVSGWAAGSQPWATQPPSSARPWQGATKLWPGSCTKGTLSSGTAWTPTPRTGSSTTTTRRCTTSAATPWRVCSGENQGSHRIRNKKTKTRI